MKRIATFTTVLVAAAALAGAVPATAHAQDNAAVAVNLRDGASIFRFAFKISRVNQDVVDNTNTAVAFASCTECQTIALAFQVVLIFSDPDVVTTENVALALNYECSACETLASAYQFVLTTGGPVHFTAEGNRRIAEIRRSLLELLRSDLSLWDLQAQVDVLADELREVLATELVAAGNPGDSADASEDAVEGEGDETETMDEADEGGTEEPATTETTPAETTETETTETTTTTP